MEYEEKEKGWVGGGLQVANANLVNNVVDTYAFHNKKTQYCHILRLKPLKGKIRKRFEKANCIQIKKWGTINSRAGKQSIVHTLFFHAYYNRLKV